MTTISRPESAPENIAFCPQCASPLITRLIGDKPRHTCPACQYIHFTDPKVGVGVMVVSEGKILLVKRAMKPEIGKWSIPAGFLDQGEDPQETAKREVWEETNLQVEISGLLDVYYNSEASSMGGASIFILYRARLIGGELMAGDDASDAAFFEVGALPDLAFKSTQDAVERWGSSMDDRA